MNQHYYSGISGLQLPIPKYQFPEAFRPSSRLTYYSSLFNSIEINRSFYELPKGKTMQKWAAETGEKFTFTFKLWKEITHVKGFAFKETDVRKFMQAIDEVGEKKGSLLIQLPPALHSSYAPALDRLLGIIRECDPKQSWKVAVEFRNESWYEATTEELLGWYDASWVIHDKLPGKIAETNPDSSHVYIRFHGPGGDYRGSYTDDFLREYADQINTLLQEGKTLFVYFNNTMGDAIRNLQTLNQFAGDRSS